MSADGAYRQSKHKRVVTSCSECYRRKQKCDRKHPCNNCRARNVTNKCVFNLSSTVTEAPETVDRQACLSKGRDNALENSHESPSLGYSLISGSNSFMGLQQILQDGEFQTIRAAHNHVPASLISDPNARALASNLPPRAVVEEIVEIFFAESVNENHVGYLKPQQFSREMQYFPAMLFQMLSLTLQILPQHATDMAQLSRNTLASPQRYSALGEELVSALGRQGAALTAVQADFLRSFYLKNCGAGIQSWHTIGCAIRQAQELGMHRHKDIHQQDPNDVGKTLDLFWYDEYKRRIWANLFAWDSLMAMILGRPRMINLDDCDVKLPTDCNIPKKPSTAVPMTVRSYDNDNITTVSASLFRQALASKVHEMRALKADRPHPKDYSVVQNLHHQVISLVNEVPPSIRPKNPDTSWDNQYPYLPQLREEILIMANLFLMTLHRSHVATNIESRRAAVEAALATLQSQQRVFDRSKVHHYQLFGLAFYTVDACCLLFSIATLFPPKSPESKRYIDNSLQQAIQRLSLLETHNKIAKAGLDVLKRCSKKIQEAKNCQTISSGTILDMNQSLEPRLQDTLAGLYSRDVEGLSTSPSDSHGANEDQQPEPQLLPFSPGPCSFDQMYWLNQLSQIQQPHPQDPGFDESWGPIVFM